MWQILITFYFIFGAASYLQRKVLTQQLGDHNRLLNAIFFLFFLLPTTIILSFFFPHNLNVGLLNLLFLFGGSLIWPILAIVSFTANKKVDVGIFAVIGNLSPIFTLLIALPFLHENLKIPQFLGIGLLIISGALAASSHLHKPNQTSINGLLICLLSAIILGLAVAYERLMLTRVDFGAYLIYGWGSQIIWSAILAGKEFKRLPQIFKKSNKIKKILIAWGTTSILRSVAFILALKLANASIVSAASNFMSVAVVIAAYFYLKERQQMLYKWISVVIGITGLLLLKA